MHNINHIQHRFGDHLFNFIRGKVASADDAQDIYQEVILKIMNKTNQLKKAESLKSWLFTIAKNQVIDFYRTKKPVVDPELLSVGALTEESEVNTYSEMEECLYVFIDQLPDDYKTIITLSEIEGRSQKELAQSLGVNYVTLRSKVQRGREKIRKMIFDACIVEQDASGRFLECIPRSGSPSCENTDQNCACDGL